MPQDPHAPGADRPFWETKFLGQMSREEWESLCDGCGKCCLVKLMDLDTEHLAYTEVSCKLLDIGTCRCTDYPNRKARVPDCVILTPDVVDHLNLMPSTCAYKLVHDGDPLPWWHPLVSGDPDMSPQSRDFGAESGDLRDGGLRRRPAGLHYRLARLAACP